MPRKDKQIDGRRRRDDLRTLDKGTKAYWEEVLRRNGLGMSAGQNTHRLMYVGTSSDIELIEGHVRTDTGLVKKRDYTD